MDTAVEVSAAVKRRLIEKYRDINTSSHDWYENVYEEFRERMTAIGVHVENIYFTGFWSQGDGACFEGNVMDWSALLPKLGLDNKQLIKTAMGNWSVYWVHRGFYYNEHCVEFGGDTSLDEAMHPDYVIGLDVQSFDVAMWWAEVSQFETRKVRLDVESMMRDYMVDLYRELEKEYESATSDEAVWDTLVANDFFNEDVTDDGGNDE